MEEEGHIVEGLLAGTMVSLTAFTFYIVTYRFEWFLLVILALAIGLKRSKKPRSFLLGFVFPQSLFSIFILVWQVLEVT